MIEVKANLSRRAENPNSGVLDGLDKAMKRQLVGVGVVTMATAGAALADVGGGQGPYGGYGPGMMWGGGEQWGGFGMVLGPIFMILVLVGIIVGVIYLIRTFAPHAISPMHGPTEDRALTILRERLAKGEIDSKEFEDRRRMLSQ